MEHSLLDNDRRDVPQGLNVNVNSLTALDTKYLDIKDFSLQVPYPPLIDDDNLINQSICVDPTPFHSTAMKDEFDRDPHSNNKNQ